MLKGQIELEKRQDLIEEKLGSLHTEVDKAKQCSSSSPDSSPTVRKRKRVVTRELSVSTSQSACLCFHGIFNF